jgi:SAM-dependent methyltransferase
MPHADFYTLPDLYDILHTPGTARDLAAVRRSARAMGAHAGRGSVWLEPACGSGRHLRVLAAGGARAIGFDLEPAMITYARRANRALGAGLARPSLFVADMRSFDRARRLPPIDVAFNLINTIRHLPSDAAMLDHLAAVARVLAPGGVYVVGLGLAAYGLEPPTEDVWRGSRAGVRVTQVIQYEPPAGPRGEAARAERVVSHLTVRRGTREEHIDSTYALRAYSLAQWRTLVERSRLSEAGVFDSDGRPAIAAEPGYYLFALRARTASA